MQTKKKKIEFKYFDIIITELGYELFPHEIDNQYFSKKKGIFVEFYVMVFWNSDTRKKEQLKTIKQKEKYWSTTSTKIVDKIKFIKRPTCQLKLIS